MLIKLIFIQLLQVISFEEPVEKDKRNRNLLFNSSFVIRAMTYAKTQCQPSLKGNPSRTSFLFK